MKRGFLSDNASGAHPKVLDAMARANVGHVEAAYGDDAYSMGVARSIAALVGGREAFFVFNGTGANVLALSTLMRPHESVLCAEGAHVAVDESAALERFVGGRVTTIPTADGKLSGAGILGYLSRRGDQHAAQPRVVSITNSTELGTVYTPREIADLVTFCGAHELRLHVDGARLANAAAAGHDVRALCAGIDALSWGGTKNGAVGGECVVLFHEREARDFRYVRKQGMQLPSKSRFVAAQFDALLADDLWLANARHANRMAQLLAREVAAVTGVTLARNVEANAVFARIPRRAIAPLQKEWPFYVWDAARDEVRFVCSFDTTEDDVRGLVASLRGAVGQRADRNA